jgi:hypothetical protein
MNTLTQEQKKKLLEECVGDDRVKLLLNGFSIEIEASEMLDLLNAAFALGVAHEREACAKACEDLPNGDYNGYGNDGESYAEAIRARK